MRQISLSELPPEILEHILSFLPPSDILGINQVSRFFQHFVSGSQYLQHRIDLFGAGLVDNPNVVSSLSERRARLRAYVDRWKSPEASVRYGYSLKSQLGTARLYPAGQDLFSARTNHDSPIVCFTRIPSSPSQETAEEWTLEFQFQSWDHLTYSQENLLVIIEDRTGFVNVHLFDLQDGSPHKTPHKKVLQHKTGEYRGFLLNSQIDSSRVALVVVLRDSNEKGSRKQLIVWNWRTGEVVLELSSDEPDIGRSITGISGMEFIDGSWLVALSDLGSNPQLLVFNTLLPRQGPRSWRILQLPALPSNRFYMIPSRHGNVPAERPEFLVDPAQTNFVIQSYRGSALLIPVGLFIRVVDSACADPYLKWEDWGRDVTKLRLPLDSAALQLVDTKVLALRTSPPYPAGWGVEVYDLSKSGQKDLQVQEVNEEGDIGCRKILSTSHWFVKLQMGIATSTFLVGNKVVCFFSRSSISGGGYNLRIWKIG